MSILGFMVAFSTFIGCCIDFSLLRSKKHLYELIRPSCHEPVWLSVFLYCFWLWWVYQLAMLVFDIGAYNEIRMFYRQVLELDDFDLQTCEWNLVTRKIVELSGLNEISITGRIMRKENYVMALVNQELLPSFNGVITHLLEWNFDVAVLSPLLLRKQKQIGNSEETKEQTLKDLRKRCFVLGVLNLVLLPYLAVLLLLYMFYRYAEEFQKNPAQVGSRRYSRTAYWKFRDFNELPHFYMQRLSKSYPHAIQYVEQFPNYVLVHVARLVAFVSGAITSVLALLALVDQDILMNFEITPGGTALFYIGLFGGIFAFARGMIPEEHFVHEPSSLMKQIIREIHYFQLDWKGALHTQKVKNEFAKLFALKLVLLMHELLSLVYMPYYMWLRLPNYLDKIYDFIQETSVLTEDGFVCSFALFDFKRHGNAEFGAPQMAQKIQSRGGKMEQSFMAFKQNHPQWNPQDVYASQFLESRMGGDLGASVYDTQF